jgi:hypothetical protein
MVSLTASTVFGSWQILSPFAYLAWIAVTILHSSSYLRLSYAFSIQQGENIDMPDDLRTWKSTGTSCEIEIHFSVQTIKFLMKYKFFLPISR